MLNATTLSAVEPLFTILKNFAAAIAIVVGGAWTYMLFVKKRQKYPRANVIHNITHKPLSDKKVLLHIKVLVTNIGDVLLSLILLETRISLILPLPTSLEEDIDKGTVPIVDERAEIDWPEIDAKGLKWDKNMCEIEPGEKDEYVFDFIIDSSIKTISIYSYVENVKKKERDIGWPVTTIYELHNTEGSKLVKKEG